MSKATANQVEELARVIADQAAAIADGAVVGPQYAAVLRLRENVDTLAAWVEDDRAHSASPSMNAVR